MEEQSNSQSQSQTQAQAQSQQSDNVTLTPQQLADIVKKGIDSNSPDGKHQAHGKTIKEMRDLHTAQRSGNNETIPANINPEYKIKECDKHLLHAVIEDVQYHPKTGKKMSVPKLQSFAPDDFKKMADSTGPQSENAFRGLSVIIVHDPAKGTAEAAKVAVSTEKGFGADGNKLTKNNIHTLNPKKLKEAYQNMFPEEKGNVPPDAMRNQILAKLAEKGTTQDDV